MTTQDMTARCQTFGDYGAPDACWRAWFDGGARWAEHCKRCRSCADGARLQSPLDPKRRRSA